MGQGKSKSISKRERNKKVTTDIPPDSQLGYKLANWNNDPSTKRKDEVKMIQYGMTEWPKREGQIMYIGPGMDHRRDGFARP